MNLNRTITCNLNGKKKEIRVDVRQSLLEVLREQLRPQIRPGSGFETLGGSHPIVPILLRDTAKTSTLVEHLFNNNILVTGLNYPVVPKGEEEIRLQVSANHTNKDIAYLLEALQGFNQ